VENDEKMNFVAETPVVRVEYTADMLDHEIVEQFEVALDMNLEYAKAMLIAAWKRLDEHRRKADEIMGRKKPREGSEK